MAEDYDVAIVGAGPAGLYLASLLYDMKIVVLEARRTVGKKACSGLISPNIRKFVDPGDSVEATVDSAVIHSPSGSQVRLRKDGVLVIDRVKFDKMLLHDVRTKVRLYEKVNSLEITDRAAVLGTSRGRKIKAKMVIGCDGPSSLVARSIGSRPEEMLMGLMALRSSREDKDVHLYYDKRYSKDGFLWRIPRGKREELGMMATGATFKDLEAFFNIRRYESRGALIPLGPGKTYSDRCLLVGDSAAQTKPWSGGGVVYGMTAAKCAAETVFTAFEEENFKSSLLFGYEKAWKSRFEKQIKLGMLFRSFLKEADNHDLDRLVAKARPLEDRFRGLDMDFAGFGSLF